MKIGEVLELTQTMKLADIAKQHLTIGEKRAVAAMRAAGCTNQPGKRGWLYTGNDPSVLDRSIYDFSPKGKATANVPRNKTSVTKKPKNEMNTTNQRSLVESNQESNVKESQNQVAATKELIQNFEQTNVIRKRSSFDLDTALLKELKVQAVIHDKNLYEMVEDAIRLYLSQLKN